MQALRIGAYGGADVMEIVDLPRPEAAAGQVLVKVEAAGMNYSDIMIRQNTYLERMPLPYVMGREFAGTIAALGKDVSGYQLGQRVTGTVRGGAFAEYVVADAQAVYPVPDGMSAGQAVAMLVQGMTAIHCLDDVGALQAGEIVLIHAAAGGVGTLAVQLAAQRGARVFGTASSAEKCALIEELGGTAINYKEEDWVEALLEQTQAHGADLILESVGGEVFKQSLGRASARFGRIVVFGVASQEVVRVSNAEILRSGKSLHGYFLPQFFHPKRVHRIREAAQELNEGLLSGKLRVIIGETYPLAEAVRAFEDMQGRRTMGKILIAP